MAKNTNVADPRRVADIADVIKSECFAISGDTDLIFAAKDQRDAATASVTMTRMTVALRVAELSAEGGWTAGEVEEACTAAAKATKAGNNSGDDRTSKTIGVLISEMKVFASPKVRDELPTIHACCTQAWADEAEMLAGLEKSEQAMADAPVRKFKSRFYHLVIEAARRTKDGELDITCADDVVDWARDNDPDHDEEKVAARLAKAVETLDGIFKDFGMTAINTAAEYLRTIKAEELLEARHQMLARERAAQAGAQAPATSPLPKAPAPSSPAPSLMPGAIDLDFDPVDHLLGDASVQPTQYTMLVARNTELHSA